MVKIEAIFHRIIKEGFPENEDEKETDMGRLFQALGNSLHCFIYRP